MMSRLDRLLCGIDRTARILEIGASFSPAAPKADGWQTYVLDHAPQEELKRVYQTHGVDCDKIETVDFVWTGGPIHEAVPTQLHASFNACIASHVVEHLPNPILFFQSLDRLLTQDGVISLALPDKRYCFDFFRPLTFSPAWMEAYENKSSRHSRRALFEHFSYRTDNGDRSIWDQWIRVKHLNLTGDLSAAKNAADSAGLSEAAPYVDCHAWCFTPSSFALLILELSMLGLINFHVAQIYPTEGGEFITSLARGSNLRATQQLRLDLLKATVAELGEQRDQMQKGFILKALRRRMVRKFARLLGG
jgi:Methyltransferase domain